MTKTEKKIKVLLVDDEVDFLKSTSNALERRGYEVKTATHGYHALRWLKLEKIDVVVLDVKMPGMDGEEVFHRIQKKWPGIPIIMLTGHGTVQQAFRTSKAGIFDYLAKPCDIEKLDQKISEAVKKDETKNLIKTLGLETESINILIVDDEEELLASLSTVLSRRKMTVMTTSDSYRALELVKKQKYDVAIVDIKMPGMDGIKLLDHLKKIAPLMEVIFLTGHPSTATAFNGVRKGAFEYLTKPPDVDELTLSIRKAYKVVCSRTKEEKEKIIQNIQEKYPD